MIKFTFISLYIFISNYSVLFSIDTSSVNYLPLNIGNKFIYLYEYYGPSINEMYYVNVSITKDSLINNKKYFFCENAPWASGWVRIDTITKSIYKYDSTNSCSTYYNNEILIDSLFALNNGWTRCGSYIINSSISQAVIFGTQTMRLNIGIFANMYISVSREYHLNIGYTKYRYYSSFQGSSTTRNWTLKGCYVNGVLYGDTSMPPIGIIKVNNLIPSGYILSQNYPNPFNPQTKIKFDVPKASFTKLIVYDLLGREAATLVNGELKSGTYETDWDASGFSSGVYFYKIISGEFAETKKMVLMK